MVVDFPAPFGPMNPVTCPGATLNDMPSSATVAPNRLRSPVTSIAASTGHGPSGVGVCLDPWRLYATAGVSAVSAADTVLTPAAGHRWPRSPRSTLAGVGAAGEGQREP